VHLNFTAAIIPKAKGEVDVEVEVRAQLGASLKGSLRIRKRKSMKFDGMTNRGRRPESFDDNRRFLTYAGERGHGEIFDHLDHFARLAQLHQAH
jgi:hypothetical protein